ncbi:MAG: DNA mismatch repair endonuclease MutL, partial [Chloroflexi bacterium]|nr:DNA mismatch repair endonuclease MutL [Chloroflexota bacterium]
MPIRVLAPDVVSMIAAGEVVERPASVVKELVENSLDASASQITIEVRGGGISLIKVSDNGTGIRSGEAEVAFQRHATSKITSLADLEKTTSLGFRGEALATIAQVAEVELVTRSQEDISATWLRYQNGVLIEKSVRAHPQGTTVTVRSLFRSVPARLKFLKTSTTENGQIVNLVTQYALAFPEVKFVLDVEGRKTLQTPGSGKLVDAMAEIYGVQVAQAMLEIHKSSTEGPIGTLVRGYVSPPSVTRATRNYLSFFVNRRWIQSRALSRAVEKAYEGLLMVGRFPIAVVSLSLDPQMIDINVHPTKREIRFCQEPIVFHTVYGTVRRTLVEGAPVPEIDLPGDLRSVPLPKQQSFDKPLLGTPPAITLPLIPPPPAPAPLPPLRLVGQMGNTYIIGEGPDGLYLIDQHAAHERVLFEKILAQRAARATEVQPLLEPLTIDVSPRQQQALAIGSEMLSHFGFVLEPFGERTWLLRAVPAVLAG